MTEQPQTRSHDSVIFTRLRNGVETFTPQQKRVCRYVYDHYRDAAFMTIEQLTGALEVGSATVMRTIRNLGYAGYKDFVSALRDTLINRESTYWLELRRSWERGEADPVSSRLAEITRQNILALENTLSASFLESFELAAEMLKNAKKRLILGLRSSKAASYYFYFLLHEFIDDIYLAGAFDSEDIYSDIARFDANDVLVAFSLGGPNYAVRTHDAIRVAHGRGIPVLLIADTPRNPSAQYAKILLSVSSAPRHYSLVPVMNLLDALIAKMGAVSNTRRIAELEKINREENIVF